MTAFALGLPYYLRAMQTASNVHRMGPTTRNAPSRVRRRAPGDSPEPSLLGVVVWLLWVLNSPPGVV